MTTRARSGLAACALLVLCAVAHFPATRAGFIWDDESYVTENANLRTADGLRRIWLEPRASPQYYPMVFTSLWADFQLHGLSPRGYHVTNILLHAAAAWLVWRLLLLLGLPGAWLAAALFAVHPVHVESVAWVTERKNVLSGALYLAAAVAYVRYTEVAAPRRRAGWYAAALLAFAAALLAKTVTCSLPAALLVLAWWKRGRVERREMAALAPFFALGVVAGLATAWLERAHVGATGPEWAFSLWERVLIAGRAVWFYAGKLAWPHPLIFVYPQWDIAHAPAWWALYPLAAAGAVALAWRRRGRWGRGPLAAILLFAGTLFPALGFFNLYPMRFTFVADHYQYLASLAPLAAAAAWLATRPERWVRPAAACLLLAFAALSWQRGHAFRDAETLWRDTLAKNPASWMSHNNLGLLLAQRGDLEGAAAHHREALRYRPGAPEPLTNLGLTETAAGRVEEGLALHRAALKSRPDYARALNNLGVTLAQHGRPAEGIAHLRRAVDLAPHFLEARGNLALAWLLAGRPVEAAAAYQRVLRLNPYAWQAANNLAWLWATCPDPRVRNPAAAVRLAEEVDRALRGRDANVLDTLGAAYAGVGRFEDAVRAVERGRERARQDGDAETAAKLDARLARYREGRSLAP